MTSMSRRWMRRNQTEEPRQIFISRLRALIQKLVCDIPLWRVFIERFLLKIILISADGMGVTSR
jgi:hypothetical protein